MIGCDLDLKASILSQVIVNKIKEYELLEDMDLLLIRWQIFRNNGGKWLPVSVIKGSEGHQTYGEFENTNTL